MSNLARAVSMMVDGLDADEPFDPDRVFLLLYLADWKATLEGRDSITGIAWTASGRVDLVGDVPDADDRLVDYLQRNAGASSQDVIRSVEYFQRDAGEALSARDRDTINFVLRGAGRMSWRDLNRLVFSTRPMLAGAHRGDTLDLNRAASEARASRQAEGV